MNHSLRRPHGLRPRLGLAGMFALTLAAATPAQEVVEIHSKAELKAWINQLITGATASLDGVKEPWVAVFPPLTGGVDKTKIGSSQAGELVVDQIREAMAPEFQNRVLSGADLVAAMQVWHWEGGDYRNVSDAEVLGATCGCDITIAGSLEKVDGTLRLELVGYRNGVQPDASGRVPTLFKKSCTIFASRKARARGADADAKADATFVDALGRIDTEPVIAFGFNAGAGGGRPLSTQDCEFLFPKMLEQFVQALQHDVLAKGVDWRLPQLGIFPVLPAVDAPLRQFALRIDQALRVGFTNTIEVDRLHAMLLKQKSSVLWYSVDPIEPGVLDELATAHGIGGFVRGSYNYVAGSGRVVVTLEYYDAKCQFVSRVRRALGDPRMVGWMNQNLDKDLTDDEAARYRFDPPTVSIADVEDLLAMAAQRAIQDALKKLGKKGTDAAARPFFLRPTLLPGTEEQQKMVDGLYAQLAEISARVIKEGAAKGLDEERSLASVPCTIAGTSFASYHEAYQKIVEQIGLNYGCSKGQVLRDKFTRDLFDRLADADSQLADQIDLVAPPSVSEGEFQVDGNTLIVQPQVRRDGDRLIIVVRVLDGSNPTRSLAQKQLPFSPRLTPLIAPQLEKQATDQGTTGVAPFTGSPLGQGR